MPPPLRSGYPGTFDSSTSLASFSREFLAMLGREYLLMGHLVDRVGMPLVLQRFGEEAQTQFSIDEWMSASPIYSRRMQRALRFEGSDVATVFKSLQLDIGAPPQFMDFQFRLDRPDYGEFWLAHCGALLDVEPFGEKRVKLMCHDIEDPTFDATAAATNPRRKMPPIHRPPRTPAGRYPHCRWAVFIDGEAAPQTQHPAGAGLSALRRAALRRGRSRVRADAAPPAARGAARLGRRRSRGITRPRSFLTGAPRDPLDHFGANEGEQEPSPRF